MFLKDKRTGKIRDGCDAEIGTYGHWHGCGKVPVIVAARETVHGVSRTYFCKIHRNRGEEKLGGIFFNETYEEL